MLVRRNGRALISELDGLDMKYLALPLRYLLTSERANEKSVVKDLRTEWALYDRVSALLTQLLLHIQQKAKISRFEEALLLLGNKVLSHLRSIKAVLIKGWHGTANSLLSLLLADLTMIMYLAFNPRLVEMWFSETQDTYQKDKGFREAFSEGTIHAAIQARGIEDTYEIFRIFRKTTHGSFWGTQAYVVGDRLVICPKPPDIRISLATISVAALFVSGFLEWLLTDNPPFGSPCKGKEYDTFRHLSNKLNKGAVSFIRVAENYLQQTRPWAPEIK